MLTDQKEIEKRLAEIKIAKAKDAKAKDVESFKKELNSIQKLAKSNFYKNSDEIIEHIANYKDVAICLKNTTITQNIEENTTKLNVALISIDDISKLKKLNKNIIKKFGKKIKGLSDYEKIFLFVEVIKQLKEDNK